jgi:acyl-ACP thioesterase
MMSTTTGQHRLRWRQWLTEPAPAGPGCWFPLRRTDTDHFEHVTNTAYWHAVHEFTADEHDLIAGPHRYVLEYNKPIRHGQHLDIHATRTPDARKLWFVVDGGVRAVAHLRAAPLDGTE